MASEQYSALLRLGPFTGVDYTTSDPLLDSAHAVSATGANATRKTGALMCERGRVQIADLSAYLAEVTSLFPCVGDSDTELILAQGTAAGGGVGTLIYEIASGTVIVIPGVLAFTQVVQYGTVLYTNAGQRIFLHPFTAAVYEWQYPSPVAAGNLTLTPTTGTGSMAAGTYYYVLTRQTVMPDGTISETSVDYNQYASPPSAVLSATGEITVTPINGLLFTGTNADGTTFTTNLYRQSSNQAGYLLVANLATNSAYIDTASDVSLLSNVALEVSRDQPPVSATNLGWISLHKSRIWCFVTVDNAATENIPEVQCWYSNLSRGWEFDSTSQVLLMQSDVTSAPPSSGPLYFGLYGNEPQALVEVGTILLALTRRQTWAVYGDSPADFFQRQIFNIGCVAPRSVLGVVGGAYWLSESGLYFFDGSAPATHPERFVDYLRGIPGWDGAFGSSGVDVTDQGQTCASFYNLTYYLHFPTLQKTVGYHAPSGEWTGELPYAPTSAAAIYSTPANPSGQSYTKPRTWNEVIAARVASGGANAAIDWYFADASYDLGEPISVTWRGATNWSGADSEKQYRYLTVSAPLQQGSAAVTLVVDPGDPDPQKTITKTFDLSQPPVNWVESLGYAGGLLRGRLAYLQVVLTGVAGQPAPQLWGVTCWGQLPPDRKLVLRT